MLLEPEHPVNLDALAEGRIDRALTEYRGLTDFMPYGGTEPEWQGGLFPHRQSDMELYRDYLRGVWVTAAQKMYSASSGPSASPGLLERQLATRFHQDFRTTDITRTPAADLLIPLLRDILTTPTNRDGFGLAPAAIPAQGAQSDTDYLAALIGLTGKSVVELRNRYRVRFDRGPADETDPIEPNVEALLGLLADTWQSSEEPFAAVPSIWQVQEQGKPLIFAPFVGRAPFFLQYEEWLVRNKLFYPENVYNVRRSIPLFDAAFRTAITGMKATPTRWTVTYNDEDYNQGAYYKSQLTGRHRQLGSKVCSRSPMSCAKR